MRVSEVCSCEVPADIHAAYGSEVHQWNRECPLWTPVRTVGDIEGEDVRSDADGGL